MPGLVKIGVTAQLEQRIYDLSNSTAVPTPFTCTYAGNVENAVRAEAQLHDLFDEWRVSPNREFFRVKPSSAVAALRFISHEVVGVHHQAAQRKTPPPANRWC